MASGEQVIELSVEETNRLRAELGLAPLRGVGDEAQVSASSTAAKGDGGEEVLQLSVSETNDLRAKLGLPPLREGRETKKEDQHVPAINQGHEREAQERIEKSKLKRQVEQGQAQFASTSLAESQGGSSTLSWAQQMRLQKEFKSAKKKPKKSKGSEQYSENDLKGLSVAHSVNDLGQGETTVLTLADAEILNVEDNSKKAVGLNEDEVQLENVNIAEAQKQRDGLKEKRQMEMGMGRAGGYAGFDDDEFMELGGTQGPSRASRQDGKSPSETTTKRKRAGFQIGAMLEEQEEETDLFAAQSGKALSLEERYANNASNDFLTTEEDEKLNPKRKKKEAKFKKKKKKDKKRRKRTTVASDDEEDAPAASAQGNLLAELEETADGLDNLPKKRRNASDADDADQPASTADPMDVDVESNKRKKYAEIMAKGNKRTEDAFRDKQVKEEAVDDEPDDAFLNAALSKARRLNRLKELSASQIGPRGDEAVLEAVKATTSTLPDSVASDGQLVFSVDETREFTRALRAREEQSERSRSKAVAPKEELSDRTDPTDPKAEIQLETVKMEVDDIGDSEEIAELAKEIKEDDTETPGVMDGGTGAAVNIGRGLGGVLNILKQTGEITKKNAGREEQKGRAKDKRTYEDYEALDLSKVVQIDERTATEKDKELAKREIKLEYRDKHGRLLTRKEAFRDLSP